MTALPGSQFPLGASVVDGGTNFAVASAVADGMVLCLFAEGGAETQIPLPPAEWQAEIDTFDPAAAGPASAGIKAGGRVTVGARSLLVLADRSGPA